MAQSTGLFPESSCPLSGWVRSCPLGFYSPRGFPSIASCPAVSLSPLLRTPGSPRAISPIPHSKTRDRVLSPLSALSLSLPILLRVQMGQKGDIESPADPGLAHHTAKGLVRKATARETPSTFVHLIQAKPSTKTLIWCESSWLPCTLGLRSRNVRMGCGQAVDRACSRATSVCNRDSEVLKDMTVNLSVAFGEH